MRSEDNKVYRFNLLFPANSEESRRAGEYLEELGRKKSTFIIAAVNEYLDRHAEDAVTPKTKADISVIRNIVREIIDQRIAELQSVDHKDAATDDTSTDDDSNGRNTVMETDTISSTTGITENKNDEVSDDTGFKILSDDEASQMSDSVARMLAGIDMF